MTAPAVQLSDGNTGGTGLGQSTTDLISFYGNTPVVQPSGTGQAAITDSSGGTAANSVTANIGRGTWQFFVNLSEVTQTDILALMTPGFAGKILAVDFFTLKAVTTGSKLATIQLKIGSTLTTGGAVALTSALCTPAGIKVAGSAVTAANTFTSSDTLSINAASVTAFVEGSGWIVVTYENTEAKNALASVLQRTNKFRTDLVALGLIAGA